MLPTFKCAVFIFVLSSGYDFGYMLKILTSQPLPTEEHEFFELVKIYFPNIYDVKYLMKSCKNLKGGLQEVADQLEVSHMSVLLLSLKLNLKSIFVTCL